MSALSQFLEEEGIATTGISLVREHTERMRPPRALWVPFELGRPLGAPDDAGFQDRVIDACLALLLAPAGPLIADFDEDAPPLRRETQSGWVCPVSFATDTPADDGNLSDRLAAELSALAPWYALSRKQRGRTTVGACGLEIANALAFVIAHLDGMPALPHGLEDRARLLKLAIEDLKAYYLEAASAQPGSSAELNRWLWNDTALSALFHALKEVCANSEDARISFLAQSALVPRTWAK